MTGKVKAKWICFFSTIISFAVLAGGTLLWSQRYRRTAYEHISSFSQAVINNNPEMEQEILAALKEYSGYTKRQMKANTFLEQYGYRLSDFEDGTSWHITLYMLAAFLMITIVYTVATAYTDRQNRKRIEELTYYLEQVNTSDGGSIVQIKEDEFSKLQDEIYKTVTNLYLTKENALQAKMNFADNIANIAHQLKTPITASFLSLQLMRKSSPNDYAMQIEKQLKRLNWLEESLLMLSKIDAGTLCLEKEKVDIYTVLNLAAENLADLLKKENIMISIPEKECITIQGDLEWTMEAFMNLMKNCMEHSNNGGCIHCNYVSNPLYAEIRIWDEGNGFDQKDIPQLFERFYRGGNAAEGGIGIGLSLAREIIEMQNGTIRAYNLPEKGACFEIRFYSH